MCDDAKLSLCLGHLPHLDPPLAPSNVQVAECIPNEDSPSLSAVKVLFGIVDQHLDDSTRSKFLRIVRMRAHSRASWQLWDGEDELPSIQ
jgi:hypothetical protein